MGLFETFTARMRASSCPSPNLQNSLVWFLNRATIQVLVATRIHDRPVLRDVLNAKSELFPDSAEGSVVAERARKKLASPDFQHIYLSIDIYVNQEATY